MAILGRKALARHLTEVLSGPGPRSLGWVGGSGGRVH